jgi:hypothetical protein
MRLLLMQQQLEYSPELGRRHPDFSARDSADHTQQVVHGFGFADPPGYSDADRSDNLFGLCRSAQHYDERGPLSPGHVRAEAECGAIGQARIDQHDLHVSSGEGTSSQLRRGNRCHHRKIILSL